MNNQIKKKSFFYLIENQKKTMLFRYSLSNEKIYIKVNVIDIQIKLEQYFNMYQLHI